MQDHIGTRSDRRPCVLVVEDEVFIRMDAADILADAGFDALEAADAEQAIGMLDAGVHADLLFTDLNMPGMNGLDLSVIVHARWPDMGLLMTSGRQDIPVEMIPDHGLFLDKPYEPQELVRMVRRCLELRNL